MRLDFLAGERHAGRIVRKEARYSTDGVITKTYGPVQSKVPCLSRVGRGTTAGNRCSHRHTQKPEAFQKANQVSET